MMIRMMKRHDVKRHVPFGMNRKVKKVIHPGVKGKRGTIAYILAYSYKLFVFNFITVKSSDNLRHQELLKKREKRKNVKRIPIRM